MSGATVDRYGEIHCHCGNEPSEDGFDACHSNGQRDDAVLHVDYVGQVHYVCNRCGSVYNYAQLVHAR
jgi:hypothetical protein